MAGRSKRWSHAETRFLISTLEDLDILTRFDGRKHKNADLFKAVASRMVEGGFAERDTSQIRNKWKALKQEYNKARAKNNRSGSDPSTFEFFEEVDRVLGTRPLANADVHGIEMGFDDSHISAKPISDEEDSALEGPSTRGSTSRSSTPITDQAVGETPESDEERPGPSQCFEGDSSLSLSHEAAGVHHRERRRRKAPRARSGYERALQAWSEQQTRMLQEVQENQHQWALRQQERREERERAFQQQEERLMSTLLEQNARSTERLFGMMFDGLRTLLPAPRPGPPPPQYFGSPQYHHQAQQPHDGPSTDSEYRLYHM